MKKILAALSASLILLSIYSCEKDKLLGKENKQTNVSGEISSHTEASQKLTLEKVTALSQKGEALSWQDFQDYDHIDTGSGLYIQIYEINDDYTLSIGGGNPNTTPPMYIYLTYKIPYERIDIRYGNVQKFIDETSKIKDGTKRFIAEVIQNGEMAAPAGKSELGMTAYTGELILSVSDCGNTDLKSDDLCSISTTDLTGNIKLPRLLVGDTLRIELDSDSEITKYSFDPTIMIQKAVSVQRCTALGEIITPLETLSKNYSIDDARSDGCVYFRDFDVLFGKENFESFLANVKYKFCGNVRLAFYYTESHTMYINDLYYNGTDFTIREIDNGREVLKTYKYLRPFITDITEDSARLVYTLTNDADVTYDRLIRGALSSRYGDYIPFRDVYTQKGFLKDGSFFDDSQTGVANPIPERLFETE